MHWLFIAASLMLAAGITLLLLLRQRESLEARRRFDAVLKSREGVGWLASAETKAPGQGADILRRMSRRPGQSIELCLRRAGWTRARSHALYYGIATLAPVIGLLAGGTWSALAGDSAEKIFAMAFFGFGTGYLLPPRFLRWRATRRQNAIREELLPILHLLRMLFDAGLSLEHALRVISEQGKELAPEMATEFGIALARINAGQERGEALEDMAVPLDVAELNDIVAILKQATRYGGNLRDSLNRLAVLIEDRRMTNLREYVSKLSAKMTVVMVVFMFPALMLFLAGPGFLALARALMRMH